MCLAMSPQMQIGSENPSPHIILNRSVFADASAEGLTTGPPHLLFSTIIGDGAALEK